MTDDHDKQQPSTEEQRQQTTSSFNDVTDHYRNIVGVPDKPIDLKSMPKPLRYFGYFFLTAFTLFGLAFIVLVIYEKLR